MQRARTLLTALVAALVELIVLAAAGNQWTVDHLVKAESSSDLPRTRLLRATLTALPWRFTPPHGARMVWLGTLIALVALIIVVFGLVYVFVWPIRRPRSFITVFLGTWGIVTALTQLAVIGALMISYSDISAQDTDGLGRWWYAVFTGPSAATVLFGGACGLVVAIVTGVVAALTGRAVAEASPFAAPGGAFGTGRDSEVPAWASAIGATQTIGEDPVWVPRRDDWGSVTESPRSGDSTAPTEALPAGGSTSATQALPPIAPPAGFSVTSTAVGAGGASTGSAGGASTGSLGGASVRDSVREDDYNEITRPRPST